MGAGVVRSMSLTAQYQERERTFRAEAEREAAQSRLLSRIRIGLFALFVLGVIVGTMSAAWRPAALNMLAATVAGFIAVAVLHDRVEKRRAHQSALADLNRESQDRIARNWSKLPEPSVEVDVDHPYAGDLDLLGHASLLHLIGPPNTPAGRQDLANWLLRLAEFEPDGCPGAASERAGARAAARRASGASGGGHRSAQAGSHGAGSVHQVG